MSKAVYEVVPVGDEGLYAIERTQDGAKHYLSQLVNHSKIGRYEYETARATAYACKIGADSYIGAWVEWHSASLPYRPVARFGGRAAQFHGAP